MCNKMAHHGAGAAARAPHIAHHGELFKKSRTRTWNWKGAPLSGLWLLRFAVRVAAVGWFVGWLGSSSWVVAGGGAVVGNA